MFSRNILIGTITAFATMMIFRFIVFGMLMADFYIANQGGLSLRPQGQELMEWLTIAELIMAYAFALIWSKGVKGEGVVEGVRYGFFMGLFWAPVEMMNYAFMPMPQNLMIAGFVLDILMFMIAGAVLAMVWAKISD